MASVKRTSYSPIHNPTLTSDKSLSGMLGHDAGKTVRNSRHTGRLAATGTPSCPPPTGSIRLINLQS